MDEKTLTIQQVAEITGLSVHTLRYYERIGLIDSIGRADNNHRRYSHDDVGWIDFLMKLRATGMSIQQMQEYATLQRIGDDTLPQRVEMLKDVRERLEETMAEMHENMRLLDYKIDIYQKAASEMDAEKSPEAG